MYQQYSMHPRIYGTCSILYVKGVCGVFGSRFAFCGSVAMNRVVQHQHKFRLINLNIRIYLNLYPTSKTNLGESFNP